MLTRPALFEVDDIIQVQKQGVQKSKNVYILQLKLQHSDRPSCVNALTSIALQKITRISIQKLQLSVYYATK